ncbi:hypothetical protein GWK47_038125 [Chionoecetes opilio]|uniref:Uncharacterized protein n=1 Tax=Chionoecetes opilio TaxID=41210 RepID=A0A8J4YED2_CHIOP|nr:hypothetical protein GWK47_038125 [Chionoecetes opilio]
MVTMLMKGADLKDQDCTVSQACLTASQIILFNCKKRARRDKQIPSSRSRHSLEIEPPLPLYIGLNLHTQTRSRKLVTQMHDLGLSVSYDRVPHLENHLATAVCKDMKRKGVVCPVQLRFQLFTVGALDNIDHNPSSTTATGSFHGTGISLFQFPTSSNMGQSQSEISLALLKNTPRTIDCLKTSPLFQLWHFGRKAWLCRGLRMTSDPSVDTLTRPATKRTNGWNMPFCSWKGRVGQGRCCCLVCLPRLL